MDNLGYTNPMDFYTDQFMVSHALTLNPHLDATSYRHFQTRAVEYGGIVFWDMVNDGGNGLENMVWVWGYGDVGEMGE